MRKMVFLMNLPARFIDSVRSAAPDWDIVCGKEEGVWMPHIKEAEIVCGWNKSALELCLQPGTSLRWIQNWGAGVEYMPLAKIKELGITLTNASGVHAYPISETIFAMMLAFTRSLDVYIKSQLNKTWSKQRPLAELHGKTIGILGVGAIGEETARLAKSFRMKVLGLRRSGASVEFVDEVYDYSGLASMLGESDYVVNTLPLTAETRRMIGAEQFAAMKPSAYFINIGRGATVDNVAMIEALREKRIAGAGLDVFEKEPLPESSPLWEMDNVIITPHTSGFTEYYDDRVIEDIFLPNLQKYLLGREPVINKVDLDLQY
jgi:phosphoglycerate dehydrogenase-like enzyme